MRGIVLRVLAALFAVSWIVFPGFGAIDLSVTWDPDWPQVLEAGWGLYFTVLVGFPFLLVAVRPRSSSRGVLQLGVATVALAVSAIMATEQPLAWVVVALAVQTALVGWLAGVGDRLFVARSRISRPLLFLAAVGAAPWLAYALDMWSQNRQGRFDSDITNGIDHYSVQGAFGLALVLLSLLAALRPRDVAPFVPVCAGLAAAYLGLVSFAWQDAAGGFTRAWSALAIAWGLSLVGVALAEKRRWS